MNDLFSTVDLAAGTASDPAPLPFDVITPAGQLRTALGEQLAEGHITLADLADWGLWRASLDEVAFDPETEAPTDRVAKLDRRWRKVAFVRGKRPLTADELAARRAAAVAVKVEAVNTERDRRLADGFTHDFGGTVGARVLQTRDAGDRVNWLVSKGAYRDAVDAGHGDVLGAEFRSADNATFAVTMAAGLAALVAMERWGAAVMSRSWALKDALAAGADPTTLDLTTGWPD